MNKCYLVKERQNCYQYIFSGEEIKIHFHHYKNLCIPFQYQYGKVNKTMNLSFLRITGPVNICIGAKETIRKILKYCVPNSLSKDAHYILQKKNIKHTSDWLAFLLAVLPDILTQPEPVPEKKNVLLSPRCCSGHVNRSRLKA